MCLKDLLVAIEEVFSLRNSREDVGSKMKAEHKSGMKTFAWVLLTLDIAVCLDVLSDNVQCGKQNV